MRVKGFQHRGHREHRASGMRVDLFGASEEMRVSKGLIFYERVRRPGAGRIRPMQKTTLLEVKDVHDDFRVAIPQHDVPSNGDAFAIGRRRGEPALKFDGNKDNAAFQAWRKHAAKHKLPLKPRRQAISLGQARREVSIVFGVPTPKFVAVMFGKPVPTAIIIVVVVSVSIPPMPVVVILAAILAVLVFIFKSCISWSHKEPKNYDGKRF